MAALKPLSEELQKIAEQELHEVPSKIPAAIRDLRSWIEQQPHLKARLDDQSLVQFLRGYKYDLEAAKKGVDNFYTFKTIAPDCFGVTDIDNPKFRDIHNIGCAAVLPTPLGGCGPRIIVHRYLYPTHIYSMDEVLPVCFAINEGFLVNDPYACICGVVYIFDMAQITLEHMVQYTPSAVKKIVLMYEKILPFPIKSFHFINVPPMAESFIKLYMESFRSDLKNRVFSNTLETLTAEHIPLKYLPVDYGGSNGSLNELVQDYNRVWDENREYFRENANCGTDEGLRAGKPRTLDDLWEM